MAGPSAQGKVRDIYDLGRELVLVATDRISAYDVILPNPIPHKGQVLTQLSRFWFSATDGMLPNHMISAEADQVLDALRDAGASISYPGEPEVCEDSGEDPRREEARAARGEVAGPRPWGARPAAGACMTLGTALASCKRKR